MRQSAFRFAAARAGSRRGSGLAPLGLLCLGLALAPVGARPALAQTAGSESTEVQTFTLTLQHQRATEALGVVQPLLSPRGAIELRPADNTITVRDTAFALARIAPALRRFDRLPRTLRVEVTILRAQRAAFSPIVDPQPLPENVVKRLREVLPFRSYRTLASTELRIREGEAATYEVGEGLQVSFRPGVVLEGGQVNLHEFQLRRLAAAPEAKALLQGSLTLRMGLPYALTLTAAEGSEKALVLVMTPRLDGVGSGAAP